MKRTAVLGGLIVLAMTLGMSSLSRASCGGASCIATYLIIDDLQTTRQMIAFQGMYFGQSRGGGRDHPAAKEGVGTKQPRSLGIRLERNRPMSAAMVEQILTITETVDPELAEKLRMICETDPEAFEKILMKQGSRRNQIGSLLRLRESDPELFEIKLTELKTDAEIYHFTEQLRELHIQKKLSPAQIAQLEGLVRAKTKVSIQGQRIYIRRLEQHVKGLRCRLEKTQSQFDTIVKRRVSQLMEIVRRD